MQRSNLAFVTGLCVILFHAGCTPESAYQVPPPPKVTAAQPIVESVPIFLEENGQTEAVEQAVVQARVRGMLQEIKFEPDSFVTEGTPLFLIEQEEYQAAVQSAAATLDSAKAALESSQAALGVADAQIAAADAAIKVSQAEFDRMSNLWADKAVAKSEFDLALARLETSVAAKQGAVAAKVASEADITNAQAQVAKAEADLVNAQLDLDRTMINAPISGRVTKTMVKRGNLVESGTPLVEIVKNDPIWANFNVSERFLLDFERTSKRERDNSIDPTNVKVQLQRSGDVGFPFEGHLDYYDPKIDQDTGTLQLRAVFDNKGERGSVLLPGLFVRVRVQVGEYENALLIPERAIGRDQVGTFVYVAGNDNKAVRKNVTLGTKRDDMIVIESGLEPNDSVIVDGIQRVRAGVEVDPG
jgi:RND family efflux transporter MFP subunit